MEIPIVRVTLLPPPWLVGYGGFNPPVLKIRIEPFELTLDGLDSLLNRQHCLEILGHTCQVTRFSLADRKLELSGCMLSATQEYIDALLARGWQLCDDQALARYQLPRAQDPTHWGNGQPVASWKDLLAKA